MSSNGMPTKENTLQLLPPSESEPETIINLVLKRYINNNIWTDFMKAIKILPSILIFKNLNIIIIL